MSTHRCPFFYALMSLFAPLSPWLKPNQCLNKGLSHQTLNHKALFPKVMWQKSDPNFRKVQGFLCLLRMNKPLRSSRYQLLLLAWVNQNEVLRFSLQNLLGTQSFKRLLNSSIMHIQGSECHSKCLLQFYNTLYQRW